MYHESDLIGDTNVKIEEPLIKEEKEDEDDYIPPDEADSKDNFIEEESESEGALKSPVSNAVTKDDGDETFYQVYLSAHSTS
jgi:hypothetical protein